MTIVVHTCVLRTFISGLEVRDRQKFPNICRWFESMEELPVYSSRVAGDSESWRKVLDMQGYGNAGVVPNLIKNEDNFNNPQNYFYSDRELDVFRSYANDRAHIADHPGLEAAARVLRNKESLEKDMLRIHKGLSADDADNACRAVISALLLDNRANVDFNLEISLEELLNSPLTKTGANYLAERICVPRDMGKLPAKAIYKLSLTCR